MLNKTDREDLKKQFEQLSILELEGDTVKEVDNLDDFVPNSVAPHLPVGDPMTILKVQPMGTYSANATAGEMQLRAENAEAMQSDPNKSSLFKRTDHDISQLTSNNLITDAPPAIRVKAINDDDV